MFDATDAGELRINSQSAGRMAKHAELLSALARNGDPKADPPIPSNSEAAERVAQEAQILHNWEGFEEYLRQVVRAADGEDSDEESEDVDPEDEDG